ncbi:MAG: hypothetical protein ABSF83_05545 [Nitrososphaerales archaeon]|jgi:hypothetical protein
MLVTLLVLPVVAHATPQSTLTVTGQDQNGNFVTGFTVTIIGPNGIPTNVTAPAAISLNAGWSYTIQVQSPTSCTFAYWTTLDSVSNPLHTSINGPVSITAEFNCGPSISSLTVISQSIGGEAITGYFTTTFYSSGSVMATGFTPTTFGVTQGSTYGVQAGNFGSCTFLNWQDNVTSNPRNVTVSTVPIILTALYSCA